MKILDQKSKEIELAWNNLSSFTGYNHSLNLYFTQIPFLKIKNYGRTAIDSELNAKKSFIGIALHDYSIVKQVLNREISSQIH